MAIPPNYNPNQLKTSTVNGATTYSFTSPNGKVYTTTTLNDVNSWSAAGGQGVMLVNDKWVEDGGINETISKPTSQASKPVDTTPKYETPINVNGYNVSKEDHKKLEAATGLYNIETGKFYGDKNVNNALEYIKNHYSSVNGVDYNSNCYYLMCTLLAYGFDFKVLTAKIAPTHEEAIIDENFINDFKLMINDKKLKDAIKKTPAYRKGCFNNIGCFGMTMGGNAGLQSSNPITGSPQIHSSLVTDALDKIHPGATAELVSFCNKIRTHAWLSLPKGSFGSLGRIVSKLQKVVEAFETLISDTYMKCIKLIQQYYAQLNGLIASAQKKLLNMIDQIVPLDLLCLILDTLQVLLDDVNFFTSLFQMSGPMLNYLNTFQNVLNTTSQFVSNPFSTIQAYLPPEVNDIINLVNQIGSDPNGFLADKLNNYGYGYVLNALQGNLLGALVNKFGPQYAAITPLGNALTKATAIYSHFGQKFPLTPATMGPNIYTGLDGTRTDVYGNPTSDIFDVIGSDYNNLKDSVSDLGTLGEDFKDLANDAKDAGTAVLNFITGKQS
jgi:hypothetical protein